MNFKIVLVIAAVFAIAGFAFSTIRKDDDSTVIAVKDEDVEVIPLDGAVGPESIVFDPNGDGPYTGVSDGRILKWDEKDRRWIEYASTSQPELLVFLSFISLYLCLHENFRI
jgi:Adipocyte plasma membrane-associated protein-like, N-terminal